MRIVLLAALMVLVATTYAASEGPAHPPVKVGRMKVTLMPEYDSPTVLVIQEGKFNDRSLFPRQVSFTLPPEVVKLTDVCSLSPGGHHYCQLFRIDYGQAASYLNILLPYSDFFIDYQYAPFTVKAKSERRFLFPVDTSNGAATIELHVQAPYRAERFTLDPVAHETYEKEGFTYHKYVYSDVPPKTPLQVAVSYYKEDIKPSVDEKYSAMVSPSLFDRRSGEIILAVGVIALVAIAWWRRGGRPKEEGSG